MRVLHMSIAASIPRYLQPLELAMQAPLIGKSSARFQHANRMWLFDAYGYHDGGSSMPASPCMLVWLERKHLLLQELLAAKISH